MDRFIADENRGISIEHFAEMCGYTMHYIRDVFLYKTDPLTEPLQIRASRILASLRKGEIRVMRNPTSGRKYPEYRLGGATVPRMARKVVMTVQGGKIRLAPGIINRLDYSRPGLDEQLED